MPILSYRCAARRIGRPSQRNPERRALFGARFVDPLDRGSATLITSLLPIIRKGLRCSPTPVEKQALSKARDNVADYYDLSGDLYRAFLDGDMQYSCAYFRDARDDIDAAQHAKKQHIAAKLHLGNGQRVLDIGCGWGGLSLFMARTADVEVLGIILSREQLAVVRRRAREEGLDDRVRFDLINYRDVEGSFERIVSIGMFEHVGLYPSRHSQSRFEQRAALKPSTRH